ncbi:hypothetical protein AOL_s00210g1 [Orbilia oligospora ATCC 24927]|uniref:Heme peroxidase n=1 Tax=Arthrobotrys oligospora (strain ATCC 24927 / CBS 115.81 / DSM 1491) TaxID=756982 RepID=G1XRJ3_ARTOA|nr:hypothetical protein AOL_s00210g1 [Orbilia oligospora ATCC 24927]EGX44212.1 hypothetical protein AOL_s00210g1 [Orbilia oligospora ATCC 24927]
MSHIPDPRAGIDITNHNDRRSRRVIFDLEILNDTLQDRSVSRVGYFKDIHGDPLLLEERPPKGTLLKDLVTIFSNPKTWFLIGKGVITLGRGVGLKDLASIVASLDAYGPVRAAFLQGGGLLVKRGQVEAKWSAMLHPPLSYLGDAFQHRTIDGSFNSVLHPHLGQAGTPYAKTVPAKARLLGAQPDPGDIFDRLMARELDGPRTSGSGLSVMLIYHATIIIHDIFRTNEKDKNISDTSSYLDLSPLYGYDDETNAKVRTGKLGLLHPDTFAENRLLRQPPGVCTYLVMYNRYHNYVARQLLRINENGRFSIPEKYSGEDQAHALERYQEYYWEIKDFALRYIQNNTFAQNQLQDTPEFKDELFAARKARMVLLKKEEHDEYLAMIQGNQEEVERFQEWKGTQEDPENVNVRFYDALVNKFIAQHDAAWKKLDDDLFGTARLITCGLYINISIHDYLRALMGFHQWNTTFTLDPRLEVDKKAGKEGLPRGIGNQVSVEFNLLYRFHCAIGQDDEVWMNNLIRKTHGKKLIALSEAKDSEGNIIKDLEDVDKWDPRTLTSDQFNRVNPLLAKDARKFAAANPESLRPENQVFFDLDVTELTRDPITNQFNDEKLINILETKMEEPISQFGPRNVPRALKAIEVAGILQARKWEIGTLNDFREFFGMKRHETFQSLSKDSEIQQALRDLYEDVDKVEFYPGIFCEGRDAENARDCDPGPQISDSTLWSAIFSDAVTLVRSDRFYTVDWNTNSLTTWGMNEVTADNNTFKSSVFHRLIQRAFPDWYEANSVRFFHPFYTTTANMKYAKEQGYGDAFNLPEFNPAKAKEVDENLPTVLQQSTPSKPNSVFKLTRTLKRQNMPKNITVVVKSREAAEEIIHDKDDRFVNPAWMDTYAVPKVIRDILKKNIERKDRASTDLNIDVMGKERDQITDYFEKMSIKVINARRQLFEKGVGKKDPVYQIDAVRDFAIPVITHYFADFLGFSDLIIGEGGKLYSTNEIYHHIVNVQNYLSYNVDETKKWKRREAFKKSAEFLVGLTRNGHVKAASAWWPLWRSEDLRPEAYMKELGYKVAQKLLKNKDIAKNADEAAAIMLLIGLDSIYNAILTFTTSLAFFFDQSNRTFDWRFMADEERKYQNDLHAKVENDHKTRTHMPDKHKNHFQCLTKQEKRKIRHRDGLISWEEIQKIAFDPDTAEHDKDHEIMHAVLEAQRLKVKLPIERRVLSETPFTVEGSDFEFHTGDTVLIDIHTAEANRHSFCDDPFCVEKLHTHNPVTSYLSYTGGFSEDILSLSAKHIPIIGLAAMFKTLGRMKYLRQGHDSQGRLKSVNNNPSYGHLANRMAPKVFKATMGKLKERAQKEKSGESFDTAPESYTYLTPEWDETMPFPNTMKIRFNGYGQGVWIYGDNSDQNHGIISLWAPQGPSHTGGSWAPSKCTCTSGSCRCALDVKSRVEALEQGQKDLNTGVSELKEEDIRLLKSLGTVHSGCGM